MRPMKQENMAAKRAQSARNAVCVWTLRLPAEGENWKHVWSLLSRDEHKRAERFHRSDDRERFAAAHASLRIVIGEELDVAPADVEFAAGPGKPRLSGSTTLRFSLSHSEEFAMVALAWDREVGIDVERLTGVLDVLGLANRFYAPWEARLLASLPPAQQRQAFFAMWVEKEALLKAMGVGIEQLAYAAPSDTFAVQPVRAPGGYVAALAVAGPVCEVTMREFANVPARALPY
jgi:4'-phosphopantetheinyl transferase